MPLLLVMATANRGYIFDMVPVEYLLEAGFDVFMLDWEPPRADEKTLGLADYMLDFLPAAIARVSAETGEDDITLIDMVGSVDKEQVTLKGGHVSLVAGGNAIRRLWPKLVDWLGERST